MQLVTSYINFLTFLKLYIFKLLKFKLFLFKYSLVYKKRSFEFFRFHYNTYNVVEQALQSKPCF